VSVYSDQEELEKLKAWWKNYGGALLIGVVLGIALLFGNKYWTRYQEERRIAASEIYATMIVQSRDTQQKGAARSNGEKLVNEYEGTPYAGMAALMLARLSFEESKIDEAREHLRWAVENAVDPVTEHTARLRLARLYLDGAVYDQALAVLRVKPAPGFETEYLETEGDIYVAQGKFEEAQKVYRQAIERISGDTPQRSMIVMKLQDLGAAPKK
jgi:predicted negative regulator of RcsB-dependent stress response